MDVKIIFVGIVARYEFAKMDFIKNCLTWMAEKSKMSCKANY